MSKEKFCLNCVSRHDDERVHQLAVANLLNYLSNHLDLSSQFYITISPMLEARTLNKTQTFVRKGEICTTAFWIESGYCRCFINVKDNEGLPKEETIDFCRFNKIMVIPECFFNNLPCNYAMEIAQGAVIVPFSRDCFNVLKMSAPEAEALANKILSLEKPESLEKSGMFKMKPRARYDEFLRIFGPEIEQYFPVKHNASYLGMQPSYLSRLRSEKTKRAKLES
jgi:hypothetical protein